MRYSVPGRLVTPLAMLAICWGTAATGQSANAQSLTDRVLEKSRRTHEYLDLLKSTDKAVRINAMQEALKDPDPGIRGLALEAYLRRYDTVTPEVVLLPGSKFSRADVPQLVIHDIQWASATPTMTGRHEGCAGPSVQGQIASGRLALDFDTICLAKVLLGDAEPDAGNGRDAPGGAVVRKCEMILTPTSQGDALEGPLNCEGVRTVLQVRLYFGA